MVSVCVWGGGVVGSFEKDETNPASDPAAGWGGGGKKHEIYVAAFGGHLFYDLFVQGWGDGPLGTPPGSATANLTVNITLDKVG